MNRSLPLDLLWPPRCLGCDAPCRGRLCEACEPSLIDGLGACCPHCGLIWLDPPEGVGDHRCGTCLRSPPPWREARAAFAYGGAIRDAIRRWKNRPEETLGRQLGELMAQSEHLRSFEGLPADAPLVPVPSHRRSLYRRGFNPAGVLAKALSQATGRPLRPTLVRCRIPRQATKGMGRSARLTRTAGAFCVPPHRRLEGPVLVVDDVMTTGATVRAMTRACLRAGATGVWVAVLARTPPD